ncbi:hypothetical protein [Sphingobacterium sp. xlx-130]|uniref:hypothetical protein n=1 Tax=Sphingobacterium sp. xlx-130 TaxID=2654323 RepID=UPI0013DA552C|nr:hypothetical protein [Sphingobacterium sp. xlx-130]
MLKLQESTTKEEHLFSLQSSVSNGRMQYQLSSTTYSGYTLDFVLQHDEKRFYKGYSVKVYLFKNPYFLQGDVVELRVGNDIPIKSRIGYFFRLDALFEDQTVELSDHTYCFARYGIEYIFGQAESLQTKIPTISATPPKIGDFFEDDTVILVVCDQLTAGISNFSIEHHLPSLFLSGFTFFSNINPIEYLNNSNLIETNYQKVKQNTPIDSHSILKIAASNIHLVGEYFLYYLFNSLLQRKNEVITRFIILYQVVEVLIDKIIIFEVQTKVCENLSNMTGKKVKDVLSEQSTERKRIQLLFNTYTKLSDHQKSALKQSLLDFFFHVGDLEYSEIEEHESLQLANIFYDFRNKLVHNYRLLHDPGIDVATTVQMMEKINLEAEVVIASFIISFSPREMA